MNTASPPLSPALSQAVTPATAAGHDTPHESAGLHVTGRAAFVDDLPEPAGLLHLALGLSPLAHGRLLGIDVAALAALPGVVAVLTAADIPGTNDCGPIVHDDPILASDTLRYLGQPVFALVGPDREQLRQHAARARDFLRTEALPAVLTARQAHALQQYVVPPMHLRRETTPGGVAQALAQAPQRLQGSFSLGGQEQFYLEGQITLALPLEDAGLHLWCSTQHPSEMQQVVAHALHLAAHQVRVECRRMGGGFGGKESQSAVFACLAALAAHATGRPVKLRVDRDDDFMITGRRHGFEFDYDVGFDDEGSVLGVEVQMIGNAGHSADLSPPVLTRALCHFDNAYWLPNVAMHGYLARTNTQSNTAFRGFGGPQGAIAMEEILDRIARHLGRDSLAVRRANFYGCGERDTTPYGQRVDDNIIHELVNDLVASAAYAGRRAAVAQFNATSPVLKRGLALTPVKFGIAFNVTHFNQAGALVHIYADGSVLVNHGGTEMGQGLNTKVAQVVATELGLPLRRVRCSATDTSKVANTSATAASTGADLNGKAAQAAARTLRGRLSTLAQRLAENDGPVQFENGQVRCGARSWAFDELVARAYLERVQLWSDGFYATPGLHWDRETLTGHPFHYFAYGAAVAEVLLDTLTGEHRLLRADLLHDVGRSINPALDIGQVEGAFVQGMGWLTSEELVWHPATGALLTHAPSTYKIPTANDVPPGALHTRLFDNANRQDSIHRSKAVGEPPLLLGFAVFFALKDAVAAALAPGQEAWLSAPATPEALLRALGALQGFEQAQP